MGEQKEWGPLRIFISHAKEDEAFCEALEGHLRPLERDGLIEVWSARRTPPGERKERERRARIEAADIILALISRDWVADDALYDESKRAIDEGRARVIPVLLRPFNRESTLLGGLQPLPRGEKPIEQWPTQDAAWVEVVQEITALLPAGQPSRASGPTPEAARPKEPGARLWIHVWAKRGYEVQPTREIDWTARFDKETLRVPPPDAWPALLAEIRAAEREIAATPGGSFVEVRGQMPLTVALAAGWAFPHGRHYRLRVEQFTGGKPGFWDSAATPSGRRLDIAHEETHADGEDLAIALSITADAKPVLDRFLASRPRPFRAVVIAAPDGGPGPRSIGGDSDAVALADAAKQLLRDRRHAHGLPARTHLFLASPVGVALFLGQTLNALGDVIAYERAPGDTYQPAMTLPTG